MLRVDKYLEDKCQHNFSMHSLLIDSQQIESTERTESKSFKFELSTANIFNLKLLCFQFWNVEIIFHNSCKNKPAMIGELSQVDFLSALSLKKDWQVLIPQWCHYINQLLH